MTNTNYFLSYFSKEYEKKYKLDLKANNNDRFPLTALFIYAMVQSVKDYPVINAVIDSSVKNIVYRDYVDFVVPITNNSNITVNATIRDCQNKTFTDIYKELQDLKEKSNKNQLSIEDLQLGTISISTSSDSLLSVSSIEENTTVKLGINKYESKPFCVDNNAKRIEPRDIMLISLTYDHRLIDGREGVLYLKRVKEIMENPVRIVFDI